MPTVLITGTSTGFGHVTTELLAARGWRVFATMRDLKRKDSLDRALKNAGLAERVTFLQLDVTDPASIAAAVKSVLTQTGNTLDAVVHNAGVAVAGVLEDLPDADIRRVMETNFFGVLALTRALLPTFRAQGHGRIVLRLEPGRTRRAAWKLNLCRIQMGARRMGRVPRLRGRSLRHRRRRHRAWPLSHRDLEQHAMGQAAEQRLSPVAAAVAARRRLAPGQDLTRSEGGGGGHRQRARSTPAALPLPGRPLCQVGLFPARQGADAAHPQRHDALSRPAARAVVGRQAPVPLTPRRARRRGRRVSWRRCRGLRFRAGRRCRAPRAPALRRQNPSRARRRHRRPCR